MTHLLNAHYVPALFHASTGKTGEQRKTSALLDLRVQCELQNLTDKSSSLLFGPLFANLIFLILHWFFFNIGIALKYYLSWSLSFWAPSASASLTLPSPSSSELYLWKVGNTIINWGRPVAQRLGAHVPLLSGPGFAGSDPGCGHSTTWHAILW